MADTRANRFFVLLLPHSASFIFKFFILKNLSQRLVSGTIILIEYKHLIRILARQFEIISVGTFARASTLQTVSILVSLRRRLDLVVVLKHTHTACKALTGRCNDSKQTETRPL